MRQGRTARRPQGGQGRKPVREPMAMISERPPETEDRAVPGHGRAISSPAAATKARSARSSSAPPGSRSCCTCPTGTTPNTSSGPSSTKCSLAAQTPAQFSLTWDQGAELALHKRIGASLDMAVYFCDPHSPWQRGTNENTNGLPAPVLPQGHRPIRPPGGLPRRGRRGTQRPATQDPRLHETKREDHRTTRRRVIASTTDNVAMEGRSNLRCCNHH